MAVTFVQNATLLITLSVLYGLIKWYRPSKEFYFQLISGLWFGFVAVAAMMMPFRYDSGIIYDGRSVVITLAGLWGGGYTTLVSAAIAILYRIYLGGAGVYAGVATLLFCGLTGLLFRLIYKRKLNNLKLYHFWLIGLVSHIVMLASQLLIPNQPLQILKLIWLPVLLVFPLAFALIAMLFRFIGDYVRSSQKIREAEEWYRTTLLSIGDAVICTDEKGLINQMNKVAEEITGWKLTEAKGKKLETVFNIINEDTRKKVESPFEKVIKTGAIVDLANHTLLISKNGNEIPIADSGAPIKNDNEIIGIVIVFRDQTYERLQQRKLLESEEIFRKTVLCSPIPIMVYEEGGKVIYISDAWSQISGFTADEIPTFKIWTEKVYGNKAKEIETLVNGLFNETNTINRGEYEIITKSGEKRIWNFYTTPLGLSGGRKLMLSIAPDVTHRNQIKKELIAAKEKAEESEKKFSFVLSNSPIIVFYQDIDLKYKWIYNPHPYFKNESVLNKTDEELLPLENATILTKIKRKVILTGKRKREIIKNTINGQSVFYDLIVEPWLDGLGHIIGVSCLSFDITELKLNEAELKIAKEKAEESEKLKSAFLANMSHEIRTPLNGILGFTNLLVEDENLSNETKKEYGHVIKKSSDGLLKIINDILDISRLETGKTILEQNTFDVCKMLSTVNSIFQKKLSESDKKQVEMILVNKLQSVMMISDESKLIQVFSNLLDNAIRFTSAGKIEFGISEANENEIEFFVSDTGIGIPANKQQLVFDRFMQADHEISRSYGGTGLGLSIVKKLVELMGGKIFLSSEPGKGTRFWFRLPLMSTTSSKQDEDVADEKNYSGDLQPGSTFKILIVEDDANSRLIFQKILSPRYKNLLFAENGEQAILLFEKESPDVILMDIGLPDANGLEVVKQIRAKNKVVRIIAQSAYALTDDERKAHEAGCDDFISKPIKAGLLLSKISNHNDIITS